MTATVERIRHEANQLPYDERETLIDYLIARGVAWVWDRPHLCREAVAALNEKVDALQAQDQDSAG